MGRVTLQTVADRVGVSRMTVSNAFSRPDQLSGRCASASSPPPRSSATSAPTRPAGRCPGHRRCRRHPADQVAHLRLHRRGGHRLPRRHRRRAGAVRGGPDAADRRRARAAPSPPATWRWTARSSKLVRTTRPRWTGWSAAGSRSSTSTRARPGSPASTSTTVAVPGPRPSTCSTSGTAASASSPALRPARRVELADPSGQSTPSSRQRMLGWLDALDAAGRRADGGQPLGNTTTRPTTRPGCCSPDPPTALLCYSDVLARGVVRAAEDLGLRVPGTCRSSASTTTRSRQRMRPALTTVRQAVADKGRAATAALTAAIESRPQPGRGRRARHCCPPSWSCARARPCPELVVSVEARARSQPVSPVTPERSR